MPLLATCRIIALSALLPATVHAVGTARLPATMCPGSGTIFHDGFETTAIPHDPSHGSGGIWPGNVTRTINVAGLGARSYHLRIPSGYTPTKAWPLVLALRGASPASASGRDAYAQQVRADWSTVSDANGFIVLAPVGNSTQGGWGAAGDGTEINAALQDAFTAYNIERSRVLLWGFSAGAHYGHALALDNADFFAAYGVSAGSLEQYACTDNGSYPPTCPALLSGLPRKIPVDIHLGSGDPLASPPYTASGDAQRFRGHGWADGKTLFPVTFNGGHAYTVTQLGQIWNNLCPFALTP